MAMSPLRRPIAALQLLLLLLLAARCATAQNTNSSRGGNNSNDNPYFGTTNFNPSMAIVIVVLISAFFFLGFFSIYIRQCAGDRSAATGPAAAAAARSRLAPRGLDPALLETFPTLVYSEVKGLKVGKATLECAVCLSEFEDEETLRLLPRCSHVFHPDCIDAWLSSHVTCPVCRSDLSVPAAAEPAAADPEGPDGRDPDPELDPAPGQETGHVVVEVADDHDADLEQLRRSKSKARPPRFPRSHSTGHDLPRPAGGNPDRFTLVLPDNVRREVVAAGMLRRARSIAAFPAEGSSRRGYRGGEGSSRAGGRSIRLGRSDRWPSFFLRSLSTRVQGWRRGEPDREGSVKKGEGEGSFKSGMLGAVRTPFDCLGGGASVVKADGDGGDNESSRDALAARV